MDKHAMKAANAFDISVFVDASERLPFEQGMTVTPDMCGIVVHNNGTLKEFLENR